LFSDFPGSALINEFFFSFENQNNKYERNKNPLPNRKTKIQESEPVREKKLSPRSASLFSFSPSVKTERKQIINGQRSYYNHLMSFLFFPFLTNDERFVACAKVLARSATIIQTR
jgi:hypothetical protein